VHRIVLSGQTSFPCQTWHISLVDAQFSGRLVAGGLMRKQWLLTLLYETGKAVPKGCVVQAKCSYYGLKVVKLLIRCAFCFNRYISIAFWIEL